jgi:hypothetical protein
MKSAASMITSALQCRTSSVNSVTIQSVSHTEIYPLNDTTRVTGEPLTPQFSRDQQRAGKVPTAARIFQGIGALPEVFKDFAIKTFLLLYYNQVLGLPALYVSIWPLNFSFRQTRFAERGISSRHRRRGRRPSSRRPGRT